MTNLKLTTQAIRKILTNNGMAKAGTKLVPALNNKICYGYVSSVSGMTVRNLIKGESIQVWAHTNHPGDDIKIASELLRQAGYDVKTEGFQCVVKLPTEN